MNREDLAKLYEEANGWSPAAFQITMEELERFAALVAAAEREACAKVCEEVELRADGLWDKFAYPEDQGMAMGARQCINTIRARSNT